MLLRALGLGTLKLRGAQPEKYESSLVKIWPEIRLPFKDLDYQIVNW